MTIAFRMGRYGVRQAGSDADIVACQQLRYRCFFGCEGLDAESYDQTCDHLMIADGGRLVATCRIRVVDGGDLAQTYGGARYDLRRLADFGAPMLELGRFCIAPGAQDGDVLRLLWGVLTQVVDARRIGLIFGCASFEGVDPGPYRAVFQRLADRHLAPPEIAPGIRAQEVVRLDAVSSGSDRAPMPPLLRSYLGMGGWVSDHAVIDREMQTLHVFTGLEMAKVPARRAAALRAMLA